MNLTSKYLIEVDAVRLRPDIPVIMSSGSSSPIHINPNKLLERPELWSMVIDEIFRIICDTEYLTIDQENIVIAGVATSGIPHSTHLAVKYNFPSCFVRQKSKEHGRGKSIEGSSVLQCDVILIEDVIITGESSLGSAKILLEEGAKSVRCVAIAGYGDKTTLDKFRKAGVPIKIMATSTSLLDRYNENLDKSISRLPESHHDLNVSYH